MRASHNGRSLYLTPAVMPLPKTDKQLDAFDAEVSEELKVLGYLEEQLQENDYDQYLVWGIDLQIVIGK